MPFSNKPVKKLSFAIKVIGVDANATLVMPRKADTTMIALITFFILSGPLSIPVLVAAGEALVHVQNINTYSHNYYYFISISICFYITFRDKER